MNSTGQSTLSCVQTVRWLTKTPGCIDRANKWRCENESVYFSMFFSCHAQFIICHKWWGVGGGGLLSTRTSGNLSLKELNLKRYNEYPNGTGETNWVLDGTYVAPFCYSNNIFYTSTTALLESDLWNSRVFHVITEPQGAVHEFIKNSVT